MYVVPHAEGTPVLRHHDVAVRHPLDVRAVAQEGPSSLSPEVVPSSLLLMFVVVVALLVVVSFSYWTRARFRLECSERQTLTNTFGIITAMLHVSVGLKVLLAGSFPFLWLEKDPSGDGGQAPTQLKSPPRNCLPTILGPGLR